MKTIHQIMLSPLRLGVRPASCCLLFAALLSGPAVVRAEMIVSLFTGKTIDQNADVRVRQPGGTDLTIHDASFVGRDFQAPLYYGARLAYFPQEQRSGWGVGLEFFHAKIYLETAATRQVTGYRAGLPVAAAEPVANTITAFNNSHGLNFLTADVLYRWFLAERGKTFLGRVQPYVGAGIGVALPHVESTVGGVAFNEYQLAGPGFQALAGLNFELSRHWSLFTEYKCSLAILNETIPGGSIQLVPLIHHFVTGLSFHF